MGHVLGFTLHAVLAAVVQARPRGCSAPAVGWQLAGRLAVCVGEGLRPPGSWGRLIVTGAGSGCGRCCLAGRSQKKPQELQEPQLPDAFSSASTLAREEPPVRRGRRCLSCWPSNLPSWTAGQPCRAVQHWPAAPARTHSGVCTGRARSPARWTTSWRTSCPWWRPRCGPGPGLPGAAPCLAAAQAWGGAASALHALSRVRARVWLGRQPGPMAQACLRRPGQGLVMRAALIGCALGSPPRTPAGAPSRRRARRAARGRARPARADTRGSAAP